MVTGESILLAALIFGTAVLYSSVGHAGASGYLAMMALVGVEQSIMRPTALVLNILVATIGMVRFYRAGHFSGRVLWPFVLGSMPFAFVGGALSLPNRLYGALVGAVLLVAVIRLTWPGRGPVGPEQEVAPRVPILPAVASGVVIGLLSGLTGTGGGIFLSPLLLFTGWAGTFQTAGVSAAFILVNSTAGLLGNLASTRFLPDALPLWVVAAALGGLIGSELGSRRVSSRTFQRLLAVVLVVAGIKLILT